MFSHPIYSYHFFYYIILCGRTRRLFLNHDTLSIYNVCSSDVLRSPAACPIIKQGSREDLN